jgi:hypothetical protein
MATASVENGFIKLTAAVLSMLLLAAFSGASDSAPAPAPDRQVSPANFATPRSAVKGFLVAARAARYGEDGLAPNRDRVGVIETSRGAFDIALHANRRT